MTDDGVAFLRRAACAVHAEMRAAGDLPVWTVYESPRDYPGRFVARPHGRHGPRDFAIATATLERLRACLPPGLHWMPRADADDPVIVEVWL